MTLRAAPESQARQPDPFAALVEAMGQAGSQMHQLWEAIDALSGIHQGDGSISDATMEAVNFATDILIGAPEVRAHQADELRAKVSTFEAEGNPKAAAFFAKEIADWECPA